MVRFVLASSSPRRHQLLEEAGYRFDAVVPGVDESLRPGEAPYDYALRIARDKALKVAEGDAIALGADTVVVYAGRAMGKPVDVAEAVAMLRLLSGQPHEVMSGWALAGPNGIVASGVEITEVEFRELSAAEIDDYIASDEPMDRAGAYAIQGGAGAFVAAMAGSFSNVMGLPMEAVSVALAAAGVFPEPTGVRAP